MSDSVYQTFGNKIRIRVCGICIQDDQLLLVNHAGLNDGDFWCPPGGGLQFGETLEDCLIREYKEETELNIAVGELMFLCEFISNPLHAIEVFFKVTPIKLENLLKGIDPELGDHQIIQEVKFMSWTEINRLPNKVKHGIFNKVPDSAEIVNLKGHFKL